MSSVNKVILLGRCGRDPETRYLSDGKAVTNIALATSTKRKDKSSGETVEDTQWHRVTFYDRLAEIAGEYLKKGSEAYIEGRLKYGKYTDKDGVEKYKTDIIAMELQLLGGRQDQQEPRQQRQEAAQRPAQKPGPAGSGLDEFDDPPF